MCNELSFNTKTSLKFDPRIKILSLVIISIIMMGSGFNGVMFYVRTIIALIPVVLLCSIQKNKIAIVYLILFGFSAFAEGYLLKHVQGNINILCLFLSGLISRFLPSGMMGHYVISSTSVSEFITAMEKIHLSRKLIIPLSVIFRFLPTIIEENSSINDAMKMRGIGFTKTTKNPITMMEYKFVPMLISLVKIGDELSAASLTKGLGNENRRTHICRIGIHVQDYVLTVIMILSFVLYLYNK